MKKLLDYHGDLKRGMVLRLPGSYPHEEYVDLMLVELPDGDRRFVLLVATGHKAELVLVKLPQEAELAGASGINWEWVVSNWNRWIYETCRAEEVYLIENYPVPQPIKAI
ncbi:hypothetical protein A7Q01_08490 [Eikenella sp. NML96-A-049]|uniref:Imm45 family immunity protein n=1 Tax=unclassified Eikenella TaxID=2639367 RepID=UPI0007E0CAE2|nr:MULTISPECIES: Imm45 family immunity protein [unclassified Eikenella]OAM34684.1 hypothetical protein A7P97_05835 [Eikenella sp. NML070372]OAM39424.1 hypothetical protein A7Q01_08490 [Eikenella sp. NML96-A-049]VDG99993.1 Uncharacterised protein [Helicobacter pametensis]